MDVYNLQSAAGFYISGQAQQRMNAAYRNSSAEILTVTDIAVLGNLFVEKGQEPQKILPQQEMFQFHSMAIFTFFVGRLELFSLIRFTAAQRRTNKSTQCLNSLCKRGPV